MRTWLEARKSYITASDLYVLFEDVEQGGFKTAWEVWHEKRGTIEPVEQSDAMRMGNLLEPVVLQLAREKLGGPIYAWADVTTQMLEHIPAGVELVDKDGSAIPMLSTGSVSSTPDAVLLEHGLLMPVEAKTTSSWGGEVKLPWALQLTAQMAHLGAPYGYVAVLVQGRQFELCRLEFDAQLWAAITARAEAFWQMVVTGVEPKVDWSLVVDAVHRVYPQDDGSVVNRPELEGLVSRLHEARDAVREARSRADAVEAELLACVGEAAEVRAGSWKLLAKTSAGSPGKVITPDMVGTTIGVRAGSRSLRVYPPKENAK